MAGNINAAGILIIILLTVFLLVRFGRKPTNIIQILVGLLLALLLGISASAISAHACMQGTPDRQILISCVCLVCILTFTDIKGSSWTVRAVIVGTITGIVLLMFLLCNQYVNLIHSKMYTGNPSYIKTIHKAISQKTLQTIREILSEATETNEKVYPPGWLSESEIKNLIPADDLKDLLGHGKSAEIYRFWHTLITSLYGKNYKPLDVWYPGGLLKDSLDSLEFKEK